MDTLPDLHEAVNLAFGDLGIPSVSLDSTRAAIGDGVRMLIQRLLPADSGEQCDSALEAFQSHYARGCDRRSVPRPGALAFVRGLGESGRWRQSVLTNKPQVPTDLILDRFGFRTWISDALGGDSPFGRKPDPRGLLELVRRAGTTPSRAILVGDGPADLGAAQAAGVASVRLDGGYGTEADLDRFPATWRVADFEELATLWKRIDSDASDPPPRLPAVSH